MPATQISFLDFAQSQALALQAAPPCTLPIVAVHAPALVVAHGGDSGGECIPRLRVRYRVDIHYPGSPVSSFLWPSIARAKACARDVPRGHAVIHMVTGYQTLFGFVESCPQ